MCFQSSATCGSGFIWTTRALLRQSTSCPQAEDALYTQKSSLLMARLKSTSVLNGSFPETRGFSMMFLNTCTCQAWPCVTDPMWAPVCGHWHLVPSAASPCPQQQVLPGGQSLAAQHLVSAELTGVSPLGHPMGRSS